MFRRKPGPDLIRAGYRFADKNMRHSTNTRACSDSNGTEHALVLLRHKRAAVEYPRAGALQHGHRGRRLTIATINLRRMVAIELGICRSGRKGGSSGSVIVGYGSLREQRGATSA